MAKAWRNLEAAVVAGIDYVAIRARGSNVTFYKLENNHFISEMIRRIFANSESMISRCTLSRRALRKFGDDS